MDSRAVNAFRVSVSISAVVAIVLGIIALVWPHPSLVIVAVLFGVYLVVSGALRIIAAVRGHGTPTAWRWTAGVVGALVVIAGLIVLLDPAIPLVVYAVLAGIGFIFEGITAIVGAIIGHPGASKALALISGIVSILGGIAVIVAPGLALTVFMLLIGVTFIVIGIAVLLLLPRRTAATR